jgi:hypothetical protein
MFFRGSMLVVKKVNMFHACNKYLPLFDKVRDRG